MAPRNTAPTNEDDDRGPSIENEEDEGNEGDDGEDDAGSDDEQGGDEAEAGEESEEAEGEEGEVGGDEPPKRDTRGSKRFQKLTNELKAQKEHNARVARELAELRQTRQQQDAKQNEQLTEQEEARKLSLMTVEERIEYKLEKAEKQHQRQMALLEFRSVDQADKAAYDAVAARDPRYARHATRVEQLLLEERKAGRSFPRETILKFVLGEQVLNAKQQVKQQREDAQRRVDSQRARTNGGGGDRRPSGRREDANSVAALERRLDGVIL